jgi:2-polyprenyl-3-methyl-5-hydroxy-6-metoxy-1,4-benzoquinol methylase
MNKNKHELGLPIEYQQMPEYFDLHNINEQTESKNALIEKLLKEQKVKTVLDMTCGTGSQVFYLAKRGYKVIGNDFSPALINIARDKAKETNLDITFIDGDMRNVKAGKFDAVISIFNAIGHLTKLDFEKALQNIRDNLKDDGVYIFDILNLQALTNKVIDDFAMSTEKVINNVKIHSTQHSEIDRKKGLLISYDKYTIFKDGCEPKRYSNSFSLQIYTAEELQEMLNRNGFEILSQYDMDGNKFITDKSISNLTIARKKT